VVNHLSDQLHASEVPPARQTTLDEQIRARIQNELAHLREEENSVREEIERALEKENLDKERALAGGSDEENGGAKSSTALMGDLEEVRQKVDRFKTRRDLTDFPEVKVKGEAVVSCFKCVLQPLT
jgi:MICOS complex subunit MIC19